MDRNERAITLSGRPGHDDEAVSFGALRSIVRNMICLYGSNTEIDLNISDATVCMESEPKAGGDKEYILFKPQTERASLHTLWCNICETEKLFVVCDSGTKVFELRTMGVYFDGMGRIGMPISQSLLYNIEESIIQNIKSKEREKFQEGCPIQIPKWGDHTHIGMTIPEAHGKYAEACMKEFAQFISKTGKYANANGPTN